MKIAGCVALVTGANRGIGRALVQALVAQGAAKVYAAARDLGKVQDLATANAGKVEAVRLDVTNGRQIADAAAICKNVSLLVNNAGINQWQGFIAAADLASARAEMETNYFGTLNMCRAFAPVLKANGGGAIINIISLAGRATIPLAGSYSASKWAAMSLTQGVRAELAKQGTFVMAVLPGAIDTAMNDGMDIPKMPPAELAQAMLTALEQGEEDIWPGDMAQGVLQGLRTDEKAVEKQFAGWLPQ
jgi:NAD(P)-dependent dehydrogenase (short-subunit alcohol dehydrogenase family)